MFLINEPKGNKNLGVNKQDDEFAEQIKMLNNSKSENVLNKPSLKNVNLRGNSKIIKGMKKQLNKLHHRFHNIKEDNKFGMF